MYRPSIICTLRKTFFGPNSLLCISQFQLCPLYSIVRKWVNSPPLGQKKCPNCHGGAKKSREIAPPPGKAGCLCFQSWRTSCNFYMPCGKPWYISGVGVATWLLQSTQIAVQLTGLKLETPWGNQSAVVCFSRSCRRYLTTFSVRISILQPGGSSEMCGRQWNVIVWCTGLNLRTPNRASFENRLNAAI